MTKLEQIVLDLQQLCDQHILNIDVDCSINGTPANPKIQILVREEFLHLLNPTSYTITKKEDKANYDKVFTYFEYKGYSFLALRDPRYL